MIDRKNEGTSDQKETIKEIPTQVLILAGGLGTRVSPITEDKIPKPLIKLNSEDTTIDFISQNLIKLGYRNITYCVGYKADLVVEHIKRKYQSKANIDFSYEDPAQLLGTAGATYEAAVRKKIDTTFILLPGDVFFGWQSIKKMIDFHESKGSDITYGLTSFITPETVDIGNVVIDENNSRITNCYPRKGDMSNRQGINHMATTGVIVANGYRFKEIFANYCEQHHLSKKSKVDVRDDLMPWVSKEQSYNIYAFDLHSEAFDVGTVNNVEYARLNLEKILSR